MKERFFELDDFYDGDGNYRLSEVGLANLQKLSEIVCNRHFGYCSAIDKEDLKQVGILKALTALKSGDYDPDRAPLKNYIYTGMRNEMKNHLYRISREVLEEEDVLISIADSRYYQSGVASNLTITDEVIDGALDELSRPKDIPNLKRCLSVLGFEVDGGDFGDGPIDVSPDGSVDLERELCLIIWQLVKG